jgi:hypothetical protein
MEPEVFNGGKHRNKLALLDLIGLTHSSINKVCVFNGQAVFLVTNSIKDFAVENFTRPPLKGI